MTMVMAPTGHASAHRPWPMHLCPLTIAALPSIKASTSPSGHTVTHAPQPMQESVVNPRVLRLRAFGERRTPRSDAGARQRLFALVRAPVANEEEAQNASGNQPGKKCFHRLAEPHAHKTEPHNNSNMKNGENGKRVAEWPMDHMPEMKDPLRLIEEDDALGEGALLP